MQDTSSKKRRFQSAITNYFTTSSSVSENSNVSHQNYAAPTNTPTPALPNDILSSLLGVGARVRKSVPEGYKTEQKKLTAYTIPLKSADLTTSSTTTAYSTVYSELEPFCGIHKIGNYAVQTFPRPDDAYRSAETMNADELENISIPSSSQDSTSSYSSTNNKRTFEPDIEEETDENSFATTSNGGVVYQVGPLSNIWEEPRLGDSYQTSSCSHNMSRRSILSPKLGQHRRRLAKCSHMSAAKICAEQENSNPLALAASSSDTMDLDDFGEAAFLCRKEEVDFEYT